MLDNIDLTVMGSRRRLRAVLLIILQPNGTAHSPTSGRANRAGNLHIILATSKPRAFQTSRGVARDLITPTRLNGNSGLR